MPRFRSMVSLVGENPLPIYLAARQVAAPDARLLLVCSDHTRDVADRLREQLAGAERQMFVKVRVIASAYDPVAVLEAMRQVRSDWPDAALNFTGGTKVMSAFAVQAWADDVARTLYLDEAAAAFRLGSGEVEPLYPLRLSPADLAALHGVAPDNVEGCPPHTWADLCGIVRTFATTPRPPEKYDKKWDEGGRWHAALTPATASEWDQKRVRDIWRYDFFAGQWLEQMSATVCRRLGADGPELLEGPQAGRLLPDDAVQGPRHYRVSGQQFEVDTVVVHRTRLFVISSTTSAKVKTAKAKAIEALHRGRQLGGGLARAVLLSMTQEAELAQVADSVGSERLAVLGEAEVRRWTEGRADILWQFLNQQSE
ncbi:MAG: hypothetical protein NT029_00755 [Armatimonadetes bacterium]|nr:hypothetical protein [Armatimonadota bacterium]